VDVGGRDNGVAPAARTSRRGLSAYAILSRYPGDLEDVAEADYEKALEIASRVVDRAGLQVGSGRPEP